MAFAHLPHALLLQDDLGTCYALLPSTSRPLLLSHTSAHGSFDQTIALLRSDREWLGALGRTRHHLCPLHPAGTHLQPTTHAAALHLLLMRALHCQYTQAVECVPAAAAHDGALPSEEHQSVVALELTTFDQHPDAHALRLHISLAARDTALGDLISWDLGRELRACAFHSSNAPALPPRAARVRLAHELALFPQTPSTLFHSPRALPSTDPKYSLPQQFLPQHSLPQHSLPQPPSTPFHSAYTRLLSSPRLSAALSTLAGTWPSSSSYRPRAVSLSTASSRCCEGDRSSPDLLRTSPISIRTPPSAPPSRLHRPDTLD